MVWKLDRLGRSLAHLVETIHELVARGIGFRSLQEQLDTTTSGSKLIFHLFASLAEFERDLIRERTTAGLAAGVDALKRQAALARGSVRLSAIVKDSSMRLTLAGLLASLSCAS